MKDDESTNMPTKLLWLLSIAFIIIWCLNSCGTRHVRKSEHKEETKTELTYNSVTEKQTETNIKTETKLTVYDKNESVTTETTYSPEDPTKEAYVIEKDGTKVVLNNSKKIVKTETKKNNTQSELFGKTEQLKKEADKEQRAVEQLNVSTKENNSKEVKKEPFNVLNLLWLLIPIALIYIFYRIYKKLPII